MASTVEEIAYEQASRSLTQQETSIESTRARSASVLAGTSVATAFLGAQALADHKGMPLLAGCALAAFVIIVAFSMFNFWPRTWHFEFDANIILTGYKDREMPEVYRYLAEYMEGQYAENKRTLNRMLWALAGSGLLLGIELVLWLVLIAQR